MVQAIRKNEPAPPGIADTVLDILEYGTQDGLITASKGTPDLRRGEKDPDALNRARNLKSQAAIRIRTPEEQAAIEVTLPIQAEGKFLGFVTGGYFFRERLSQSLKDQALHPIFLKEGDRLVTLNAPGSTIPKAEQDALLSLFRRTDEGYQEMKLIGVPHTVDHFPALEGNTGAPVELIVAYSHRNEIESRQQLVFILLITGGVGLIFVYMVSYVIGLQVTKPINQLAAGAAEIASGNLKHQATVQSRDEIGGLAGAFNQMAADLKANLDRRLAAERVAA